MLRCLGYTNKSVADGQRFAFQKYWPTETGPGVGLGIDSRRARENHFRTALTAIFMRITWGKGKEERLGE